MMVMLFLGVFYLIYGILGLFGVQIIPSEYKGKNWTKSYIRCRGVSWMLLGVPWLVFYLTAHDMNIDIIMVIILVIISIPSIVFSFFYERKYKTMLKNNQE